MSIEVPAHPEQARTRKEESSYARLTAGGTAGNERLTTVTGIALAGALTGGTALAIVAIPQFGPWLHASHYLHH